MNPAIYRKQLEAMDRDAFLREVETVLALYFDTPREERLSKESTLNGIARRWAAVWHEAGDRGLGIEVSAMADAAKAAAAARRRDEAARERAEAERRRARA